MPRVVRILGLAVLGCMWAAPASFAAGLDPAAVEFKAPSEIKWVRNAAGTNEQAVLFGDPSKPGPYVVRLKWLPGKLSRPHFHPTTASSRDLRSGGWDRRNIRSRRTCPPPALRHPYGQSQYDGARTKNGHPGLGHGAATSNRRKR